MDRGLFGRAMAKFLGGLALMGLLLFLSMPLVLGSTISFVIMLAYIPIISGRIRNEERVLEEGLAGYADYKRRVRHKVIPFVW